LLFCALLYFCSSSVRGIYFDMSDGDPGGLDSPCPPSDVHPGVWTEADAAEFEGGPGEGKVLKSETGTKSCLRTRELLDVRRDFTFKMSVFTPKAEIESGKRKIQVFLVEADDGSYLITETKGPSEAGWFLIESKMPVSPGIIYEEKHRVRKYIY